MSEALTYKPLEKSFKHKGFDYRQIDRVGDVAIFEQTKDGLSCAWYEVVIVQRYGEREIGGKKIEATEAMPPASAWGRLGWTLRDKAKALEKFCDLIAAARFKAEAEARLQ